MEAPSAPIDDYPNALPRPATELATLKAVWALPRGWRIVTAVNNTVIGYFYIGTAFLFFLLAGILALLMRTQLALPGNSFLSQQTYNQVFTMHGTVMMFLFAVPVVEAMGVMLLPQMLGARDLPFPQALRLRLLGLFRRRSGVLLHLVLRSGPLGRLVHVSAPDRQQVLARYWRGLLAAGNRVHRDLGHRRRDRDHRGRAANPCTRHDAGEHAAVCMDHAGVRSDDRLCISCGHSRNDDARARARVRLAVLRGGEGRRPAAVAASVLVLRSSGGLHHLPAGCRHGVDDRAHDGAHAARRLRAGRGRADRDRFLQLRPVGTSHVHHRHPGDLARAVFRRQHGGVAAERDSDVCLDRDAGQRAAAIAHTVAFRARASCSFSRSAA